MSFKVSEVTVETNYLNRHTGSSIALSGLTISSCERLDKPYCLSAISNQVLASLSIANILYEEVKGVLELKRIVEA
jgi:hypothetical protein